MQSSGSQLLPVAAQLQQIQPLVVCIVVIVFVLMVVASAVVVVVVVMFAKLPVFAVVVAVVPLLLVMVGELCVVLQSLDECSVLPYTLYPQVVVVWISVVVLVVAVAGHSLTMAVVQVVGQYLVQSPLSSTVKVWFSLFRSRLLFVLLRHQ